MSTVEQIYKLALPRRTRILAGEAGLSREVGWVVTLKPTPPAFDSIRGGELALVSVKTVRLLDERMTLPRLLESLGKSGIAAVAVLGQVPPEAKKAAEELGMPLFQLPAGSSFHRIEQSVTKTIIELRSQQYQQEQAISRQLIEQAIHGKGIPAITGKLFEITGKTIAIADETFELENYNAPPDHPLSQEKTNHLLKELKPAILGWLATTTLSASDPPVAKFKLSLPGMVSIVAPIIITEHISRFICILGKEQEMGELEWVAAAQGAAACAIVAAREQAVVETADRIQTDFLSDLLTGNFQTDTEIINRAERFGYDLTSSHFVLALRVELSTHGSSPQGAKEKELNLSKNAVELLKKGFALANAEIFCQVMGDAVVLLHPVRQEDTTPARLKEWAQQSQQRIMSSLNGTVVSIGIGRFYPTLRKLKLAYQEAEQALAMGTQLFGKGSITYFGDLGIYRLLFSINPDELKTFYQECIGRLAEYDRKHGGELMGTLQARLECSTLAETAQALHIHRNTLLYRLQRIQEIADLNLEDGETRLALHLALKAGDIIGVS
ncbi:MAG: helix-turn-helix domain-containing protein [Dehalococcoidales bacterium]|nr:helix-turn-helix domain-containing protein [Dehalococcoidales bacterium]